MTIVAEEFTHVIGVDTHASQHAYALVEAATGQLLEQRSFPTSAKGIARAVEWITERGGPQTAVAVEGSGSYGATLTRALQQQAVVVFEVRPPARGSRARDGKSDQFDAIAAARSVLHAETARLATPRAEGLRAALHVRSAARRAMRKESNAAKQRLIALLRIHSLGITAREEIAAATIETIAAWRPRHDEPIDLAVARDEATRQARRIIDLRAELAHNERQLRDLISQLEPTLLELPGVGPISAGTILDAYSHHGRIHTEGAFARMGGVAPIPVYSGKTGRHRLNRGQNRALNEAFATIVKNRRIHDPQTRAYIERRRAENKDEGEIQRILRRYVARSIYRHLQAAMT